MKNLITKENLIGYILFKVPSICKYINDNDESPFLFLNYTFVPILKNYLVECLFNTNNKDEVINVLQVLEDMANSDDLEVQNVLQLAVFENLSLSSKEWETLKNTLLPNSLNSLNFFESKNTLSVKSLT